MVGKQREHSIPLSYLKNYKTCPLAQKGRESTSYFKIEGSVEQKCIALLGAEIYWELIRAD
jgi:hypothetical protein